MAPVYQCLSQLSTLVVSVTAGTRYVGAELVSQIFDLVQMY